MKIEASEYERHMLLVALEDEQENLDGILEEIPAEEKHSSYAQGIRQDRDAVLSLLHKIRPTVAA